MWAVGKFRNSEICICKCKKQKGERGVKFWNDVHKCLMEIGRESRIRLIGNMNEK